MWQMGGVGPMIGQAHHFLRQNPGKAPYAEERYHKEALRLYGVLDRRLEGRNFMSPATIPSPISRPGLGLHALSGTRSISINSRT